MDKKQQILDDIFGNDPLGLLNVKARAKAKTTDQRLLDSFEEVNQFIDDHGCLPKDDMSNITEFELHARLEGFLKNSEKCIQLKESDRHNLLPEPQIEELLFVAEPEVEYDAPQEINSIDDIFSGDTLDILGGDDSGLFDLKHVKKPTERADSDFVAQRKPCKDFAAFEFFFQQVHRELRGGSRELVEFKQSSLKEGGIYLLNGMLLKLESVKWEKTIQKFNTGIHHRPDGRTRTIFENGTESEMMYQSLYKALHFNGKSVSNNKEQSTENLMKDFGTLTSDDEYGGYIYVLQTESADNSISNMKDLHKVGFCTTSVQQRIQDAHKQATYLMAPVRIITSWKCYNMNANFFEGLLHKLFGEVCLDVEVTDFEGKKHRPREWFIVPLEVIEQAVDLMISGQIVNYKYDHGVKELVLI